LAYIGTEFRKLSSPFQLQTEITALSKVAAWFITFHLVMIGWILFRAQNIHDAWYILTHIPGALLPGHHQLTCGVRTSDLLITSCFAVIVLVWQLLPTEWALAIFHSQGRWFRWTVYYVTLCLILVFGKFNAYQFIYFQF
jgi:hypothetical protein